MAYAKQFTCPECKWTIVSTGDSENLLSHLMVHRDQSHPGMEWRAAEIEKEMKEFYLMKQFICPECGWTLTVDTGDENIMKHLLIHNKSHEGMKWAPEDYDEYIKEVWVENKEAPKAKKKR